MQTTRSGQCNLQGPADGRSGNAWRCVASQPACALLLRTVMRHRAVALGGETMDLVYLALTGLFFGISLALVELFDRL